MDMDMKRCDKISTLSDKLNKLVRVTDALENTNSDIMVKDGHGDEIFLDEIEGIREGMLASIKPRITDMTEQIRHLVT